MNFRAAIFNLHGPKSAMSGWPCSLLFLIISVIFPFNYSFGQVAAATEQASAAAPASCSDCGSDPAPAPATTVYFEQGNLLRAGEAVAPLGPNLMGDRVNEYNGALEFDQTDVVIPGNNSIPVSLGRRFVTGSKGSLTNGLFGDWEIDIPHLQTVASDTGTWNGRASDGVTLTLKRCSQFYPPGSLVGSASTGVRPKIDSQFWWDGYKLITSDGAQTLIGRDASNNVQPSDGNAYPVLTKKNWQFSCIAALANGSGEGFLGRSPDGLRYQFDHIAQRAYPAYQSISADSINVGADRSEIFIFVSQVSDRFGNWVRYTYDDSDPWKISSITSSDGRSLAFSYLKGTHLVQSVFDGTASGFISMMRMAIFKMSFCRMRLNGSFLFRR